MLYSIKNINMIQIDLMNKITEVGGILSAVLAVGVIALWLENKALQNALSKLNESVRVSAREDMRIVDKLTNTIEKSAENDGQILRVANETLTILKERNTNPK